jgi:hypothetical protein
VNIDNFVHPEVMEMHLEGTEVDVLEVMRELGFVK